jgi:tetratricopeptide (TPR) repeat protein
MESGPPPTRARGKNQRAIFFVIGMLVALGALVFTLAPREWFERAEVTEPDMGTVMEQDPEHQLAMLEEMWSKHPDHSPIALQIAQLYADRGAYTQAVKYYREFLKVDTSSTGYEAGLDLAQALVHLRQTEQAITELRRILKRNPDHAGALYNWGAIAANSGDMVTAKQIWLELIAKHPTDTLAIFAKKSLPLLDNPAAHP